MAKLRAEDMEPVRELLERLGDVQQCIADVRDAQGDCDSFRVKVYDGQCLGDVLAGTTHRQSTTVVLRGLEAMERELRVQLMRLQIEVSAPAGEVA
jgi:hypothetical protein